MKALIIDDEKYNRENLKTLLARHCHGVQVAGEAENEVEARRKLLSEDFDVVFLDIVLPGKNGFELLASMGSYNFEVIFVTGYDQFAIQAFKFSAIDYLLKPIKEHELKVAVSKAAQCAQQKNEKQQIINLLNIINDTKKDEHKIGLHLADKIRLVSPGNIIRFESNNSYSYVYIQNEKPILLSTALYEFEALLKNYNFIKVNRSWLVNLQHVESICLKENMLQLSDGCSVPFSRTKKDEIKQALIKIK